MTIKDIKQEHLKALTEIVFSSWNFEKFDIDPQDNLKFSFLDLYDCLSRSNYAKVAIIDQKPVGFLLGRDFTKPVNNKWTNLKKKVQETEVSLKISKNYPLLEDFENIYKEVNSELKSSLNIDFDAELILFAVGKNFKRKGIGSALLGDFESFLLNNNLKHLYVFTDTTCDYQFYEKNNFKKLNLIRKIPKIRKGEVVEFYIYGKNLNESKIKKN